MLKMEKKLNNHLKCISKGKKIILGPTDGKETIAKAKDIFPILIDLYFKNWGLNTPGVSTKKTMVRIYEVIRDGTFNDFFGSFGENLDCLCLGQSQVVKFCKKYLDQFNDVSHTLFLFKTNLKTDFKFFVAQVYKDHNGILVRVHHLLHERIWHPDERLRIIVPRF
jgi:hypothetical protein